MCIICVDYLRGALTAFEVRGNMGEMVIDPKHKEEIETLLASDEDASQ